MEKYLLSFEKEALNDIQEITDWYNEKVKGLGSKFQKQVLAQIKLLTTDAKLYKIRAENFRFLIVKKFPFLVYYELIEKKKLVIVYGSRNPETWKMRVK
jgi:toxin ParE1/3/4